MLERGAGSVILPIALSRNGTDVVVYAIAILPGQKLDGGGECRADAAEDRVDLASQRADAGGYREGDQSNEQGILDQILTFFRYQALDRNGQLRDEVGHVCSPLDEISQSLTGVALYIASAMPNPEL